MNFGFLFCGFVFLVASMASGRVILIGSNISTLSFDDIDANFGKFKLFYFYCFNQLKL